MACGKLFPIPQPQLFAIPQQSSYKSMAQCNCHSDRAQMAAETV